MNDEEETKFLHQIYEIIKNYSKQSMINYTDFIHEK